MRDKLVGFLPETRSFCDAVPMPAYCGQMHQLLCEFSLTIRPSRFWIRVRVERRFFWETDDGGEEKEEGKNKTKNAKKKHPPPPPKPRRKKSREASCPPGGRGDGRRRAAIHLPD